MEEIKKEATDRKPNISHAWRGSWYRPMLIDEDALDPLTVARMTDHNVRGPDLPEPLSKVNSENQLQIRNEKKSVA